MAHLRNVIPLDEARQRRAAREERPVTKAQIAAHYGVDVRTISRWMARGLPYHKPYEGGAVRLYISECDAWFRSLRAKRGAR